MLSRNRSVPACLLLLVLAVVIAGGPDTSSEAPLNPSFVAFGSNLDPNYVFYAPLTALMWARLGFKPIVMMFTDGQPPSPVYRLVEHACEAAGARVETVSLPQWGVQGPMVGRMYASCLDLPPAADVLLTDVDMWVLDNSLWQNRNQSNEVHYYGFMMVDPHPEYWSEGRWGLQMCHIQATVKGWRELLRLPKNGCDVANEINKQLHAAREANKLVWEYDQNLISSRVREWVASGHEVDMHRQDIRGRHLQMDGRFRPWDQQAYPEGSDFSKFQSAHVPRPGFKDAQWVVTRRLLADYLSADELARVDEYVRDFRALVGYRPAERTEL